MNDGSKLPIASAAPWWRGNRRQSMTIKGGTPLSGIYPISGAKNAALPLMVAALLGQDTLTLHNVPGNEDVAVLSSVLKSLGAKLVWSGSNSGRSVAISADNLGFTEIDGEDVAGVRASILLLGAQLARFGKAHLPVPRGDLIGVRNIDLHLSGLGDMGATIRRTDGRIEATASSGLRGAEISLRQPSVGATENLLLAAVSARGTTVIGNAALEPEIGDLIACLSAMGAQISGVGTSRLTIEGGNILSGAAHTVIPDRIEMGTLACAAAITNGELLLQDGRLELLGCARAALEAAGVELLAAEDGFVARRAAKGITATDITTRPYPGFATDLQPLAMALLSVGNGASSITETIFERRFGQIDELCRMGARITLRHPTAVVRGVSNLQGAEVTATDIRAAAALVIAGLAARGDTLIHGLDHLDRGYDSMPEKLADCGAKIS